MLARLDRLRARLRRAASLRRDEQRALAEVAGVAALIEIAVRTVPLDRLAPVLGIQLRPVPGGPEVDALDPLSERERLHLEASRRLFAVFHARGPCLRRSLVEGFLLRRRRPVLRIGVRREGDAVAAHAWIDAGPIVTEAPGPGGYRTLRSAAER